MNVDRIKEEIGWLKVYFTLFFAADGSLIAWAAQHWEAAERMRLLCSGGAALIMTAILAFTNRRVYKLLDQLEKQPCGSP